MRRLARTLPRRASRAPVWLAAGLLLSVAGCGTEPTRWDEAQQRTEDGPPAVAEASIHGSEFNKFFPEDEETFDVVFKQEKDGYAEASLKKDGTEVATFSISDTANNPSAADKFKGSTEMLGGFPSASAGSKGTAVLVADRFQVQVRSKDDAFDVDARRAWLEKFDLDGLSRLKK